MIREAWRRTELPAWRLDSGHVQPGMGQDGAGFSGLVLGPGWRDVGLGEHMPAAVCDSCQPSRGPMETGPGAGSPRQLPFKPWQSESPSVPKACGEGGGGGECSLPPAQPGPAHRERRPPWPSSPCLCGNIGHPEGWARQRQEVVTGGVPAGEVRHGCPCGRCIRAGSAQGW